MKLYLVMHFCLWFLDMICTQFTDILVLLDHLYSMIWSWFRFGETRKFKWGGTLCEKFENHWPVSMHIDIQRLILFYSYSIPSTASSFVAIYGRFSTSFTSPSNLNFSLPIIPNLPPCLPQQWCRDHSSALRVPVFLTERLNEDKRLF